MIEMLLLSFLAAAGGDISAPPHPARHSRPRPAIIREPGGAGRAFQRWESGQWQVLAGPDYCAADFQAGDIQFSVEQYWWTGAIHLQLMSRDWLSLASRAGGSASLQVTVNGIYSWTSNEAIIAGNAEYGGFAMVLNRSDAASMPVRLSRASSIDFVADGRTLGSYDVSGAAEAVQALESCVALMRSTDHSDPFAPQRR